MMTIEHKMDGKSTVALFLAGRLDTANAPMLERKIKQWDNEISEVILDFSDLTYISSMGLRVLLQAHKTMKENRRKLTIKNMNESVREVFEMTGFLNLMVAEEEFVVIRRDEPGEIILSLNGKMKSENVPVVSKELLSIREQKCVRDEVINVILDMQNLSSITLGADKLLKQAIVDTAWGKRTFGIKNAAMDIQAVLEAAGLGTYLSHFEV